MWSGEYWAGDTREEKKKLHWHFSRKRKINRRQVMLRLGAQHSPVGAL